MGGRRKQFSYLRPLIHAPAVAILVQLKEREGIAINRESEEKKKGRTRQKGGTQTTTGGECINSESARTYDLLAACARAVPPRLRPPRRGRRKGEGIADELEALLARKTPPVGSLRQEKNANRRGEGEQRFRSAKCNIGLRNPSMGQMPKTKCDTSDLHICMYAGMVSINTHLLSIRDVPSLPYKM